MSENGRQLLEEVDGQMNTSNLWWKDQVWSAHSSGHVVMRHRINVKFLDLRHGTILNCI